MYRHDYVSLIPLFKHYYFAFVSACTDTTVAIIIIASIPTIVLRTSCDYNTTSSRTLTIVPLSLAFSRPNLHRQEKSEHTLASLSGGYGVLAVAVVVRAILSGMLRECVVTIGVLQLIVSAMQLVAFVAGRTSSHHH